MYRTGEPASEEIVLTRGSRMRVPYIPRVVFTTLYVCSATALAALSNNPGRVASIAAVVFSVIALATLVVRSRPLTISRKGNVLHMRGDTLASVVVGDVLDVDIACRSERVYAVFFVLRDGRRVDAGKPRARIDQAVADRDALRSCLTRP